MQLDKCSVNATGIICSSVFLMEEPDKRVEFGVLAGKLLVEAKPELLPVDGVYFLAFYQRPVLKDCLDGSDVRTDTATSCVS